LFLYNLRQPLYCVNWGHDMGNFVDRRNYTPAQLIISQRWEILPNMQQMSDCHIIYIQRVGKY